MLYSKDYDKKYTTMCMEFDEEFYSGHRDDDKLFKYMYLVFYMLACKSGYFRDFRDFDKYAQYAAKTIYQRYLKKEKNGIRIKSLLNYAKSCKGHLKTDYQKEEFQEVTQKDDADVSAYGIAYRQEIQNEYTQSDMQEEIEDSISNIKKIFYDVIHNYKYTKNEVEEKNLYISCLLTMISSITLRDTALKKLDSKSQDSATMSEYLLKQFQKEREEEPILWQLDESYKDIIKLLVNKIRVEMSEEINSIRSSYTLPDDIIDSIISNTLKETHYSTTSEENYLDD